MSYIGQKPANKLVTSSDMEDDIVTSAKIVDATIATADIANVNVTQGKIANQAINEAKMQISNAPTNGYFLSAQSGNTGGMTWVAVPAADFGAVGEHLLPSANDTYDLGSASKQWRNIYTGDLHLSNEAKTQGNSIDGTKGNWTIQEGSEELYILNNKSGKKYKFKLEEII